MINELKDFFRKHGHTYVPSKNEGYNELFKWVCEVRKNKEQLSNDIVEQLDKLNFEWNRLSSFDQLWMYRYHQLLEFKKDNGHTRVPYGYKKTPSLGAWVHTQRRAEITNTIDKSRREMLDKIGFSWCNDIKTDKDSNWIQMYEVLKAFKSEYGHTNVPSSWSKNRKLARWVSRQREIKENIHDRHKQLLDELGFQWSVRDISWFKMYYQLKEFYDNEGHSLVPHHYEGSTRLSEWVYRQRQYTHRLNQEQIEKLNEIDFVWKEGMEKLQFKNWRKMYGELKNFYKEHGHSRVPSHSKTLPKLSTWVSRQRMKKDKLEKWQLDRLNEVEFKWPDDIRKEKRKHWISMFAKLKTYKSENGHCNVPSFYAKDEKLGRWVETQRLYFKKMDQWKVDMLEKIGFQWSEDIQQAKKQRWYSLYDRLKRFYEIYGHSRVPEYWEEDPELSLWVIAQRRPKKPHSLERKRLLEDLNFIWNNQSPKRERDIKGRFKPIIQSKTS